MGELIKNTKPQAGTKGFILYYRQSFTFVLGRADDKRKLQRYVSMCKDTKKNLTAKQKALKKARKKYFSFGLAINLAKKNPESPLYHSYINTLACAKHLVVDEKGKAHSKYCKNRWCPLCQSIRIARLIDGYKSQLEKYPELFFVTLTRPTVPAEQLKEQRQKMYHSFTCIRSSKYFRKNEFSGLRKAECTIRPNGHYHFHFHVLVNSKEAAEYMVKRWLKLNPDSDPQAQNIRTVDKSNGSMLEIFKYFTKLIAKLKNADGTEETFINYTRLNVIFEFMRGQRVFQPFGSLHPINEDFDEEELDIDLDVQQANSLWRWSMSDWYNIDTGELLTGYVPAAKLTELINGRD